MINWNELTFHKDDIPEDGLYVYLEMMGMPIGSNDYLWQMSYNVMDETWTYKWVHKDEFKRASGRKPLQGHEDTADRVHNG